MKRLAMAAALSLITAGAALAQSAPPAAAEVTTPPDTAEACIAAAADLGVAAESKTFSDEKLDRLDQLFSKMETLCDGKQFSEAMTVAGDIKTMLDAN